LELARTCPQCGTAFVLRISQTTDAAGNRSALHLRVNEPIYLGRGITIQPNVNATADRKTGEDGKEVLEIAFQCRNCGKVWTETIDPPV
jgi:predicted RNA-binding Zn-ribbon protein involved in translation (DUF1610 family)